MCMVRSESVLLLVTSRHLAMPSSSARSPCCSGTGAILQSLALVHFIGTITTAVASHTSVTMTTETTHFTRMLVLSFSCDKDGLQ